jgi:hypothetical protein
VNRWNGAAAMTYVVDLTGIGRLKYVGYLSGEHSFITGIPFESFFDRLVGLEEHPFWFSCGDHNCDIGGCRPTKKSQVPQPTLHYRGRTLFLGDTDIYVPGEEVVYIAPSLILHYIQHHQYQPPSCFVEAVLNCPEPLSEAYCTAITRIAPEMNLPLPNRSG